MSAPYTAEELARMERDLARDLDLLASGWQPTAEQLAAAPHIDKWAAYDRGYSDDGRPILTLVGHVTGHAKVKSPIGQTGRIEAIDPHMKWIRTLRGWWRLGTPDVPAPPAKPAAPQKPSSNVVRGAFGATVGDLDDEPAPAWPKP